MEQKKRASCYFCWIRCGVIVHLKDGKLEEVRGDPENPANRGFICARCEKGAKEFQYHPDRLKYPLKRVGKRGENKWEQIPWDQAFDEISQKLAEIKQRYGAEAVATSRGTARSRDEMRLRFMNLFGSPNIITPGIVCYCNDVAIEFALYGTHHDWLRVEGAKCIMVWGRNPAHSSPSGWEDIVDQKKRGAKIISVNSTYNEIASIADINLQLRPGTDTAMGLGMLNVIINEELYDKEFVEKWCHGFEKLRERVQEYPPEKIAEITWVSKDKIVEAARMFATTKPACLTGYLATDQIGRNATYAIQAKIQLRAITGNLDVPGGTFLQGVRPRNFIPEVDLELNEKLPPEQKQKQLGRDRFKVMSWAQYDMIVETRNGVWNLPPVSNHACAAHDPTAYRAMITGEPYPVKALLVAASNPLVAAPDSKLVYEALKKLDLLVVHDYWMTPTAMLADYVTPAASWLERPDLNSWFGFADIAIGTEAVLPPTVDGEYDRRNDYDFWRGLGIRLGQEEFWPWETLEDCFSYRLQPLGMSFTLQ